MGGIFFKFAATWSNPYIKNVSEFSNTKKMTSCLHGRDIYPSKPGKALALPAVTGYVVFAERYERGRLFDIYGRRIQ